MHVTNKPGPYLLSLTTPFPQNHKTKNGCIEKLSETHSTVFQFSQEKNLWMLYQAGFIDEQGIAKPNTFQFPEVPLVTKKKLHDICHDIIMPSPKDLNKIPETKRNSIINTYNEIKKEFCSAEDFPFFWDKDRNLMGLNPRFAEKIQFSLKNLSDFLRERIGLERQNMIGSGPSSILGAVYHIEAVNSLLKGACSLSKEDVQSQFIPSEDYDFWMMCEKENFSPQLIEEEIINFFFWRLPHTKLTAVNIKILIRELVFKHLFSPPSLDDQKVLVGFSNKAGIDYDLVFSTKPPKTFVFSNGLQLTIPLDFNFNHPMHPHVGDRVNPCQCLFDKIIGILRDIPSLMEQDVHLRKTWVITAWTKGCRIFSERLMNMIKSPSLNSLLSKLDKADPLLSEKIFAKMVEAINTFILMQQNDRSKDAFTFWKSFCQELKSFTIDQEILLLPLFEQFSDPLRGIYYLYQVSLYAMPSNSSLGYVLNGDLKNDIEHIGLKISYKNTTRTIYFFERTPTIKSPLNQEESLAINIWLLAMRGTTFSKEAHFFDPFIKSNITHSFLGIAKRSEEALFSLSYDDFIQTSPLTTLVTSSFDLADCFISRINARMASKAIPVFFQTAKAVKNRESQTRIALAFIADLSTLSPEGLKRKSFALVYELKKILSLNDFETAMTCWIDSSASEMASMLLKYAAGLEFSYYKPLPRLLKDHQNISHRPFLLLHLNDALMNHDALALEMKGLIIEYFEKLANLDLRKERALLSRCLQLGIIPNISPFLERMIEQIIIDSIVQKDLESTALVKLISNCLATHDLAIRIKEILSENSQSEKILLEHWKALISLKKIEQVKRELVQCKVSTWLRQEVALLHLEELLLSNSLEKNQVEEFLKKAILDESQKMRALFVISTFLRKCANTFIKKILFHQDLASLFSIGQRSSLYLEIAEWLIHQSKWNLALEILQTDAKTTQNIKKLIALSLLLKSKAPEDLSDLINYLYHTVPSHLVAKNDLINYVPYLRSLCVSKNPKLQILFCKMIKALNGHSYTDVAIVKEDIKKIINSSLPVQEEVTPIANERLILGFNKLLPWLLKERLFNEFLSTVSYFLKGCDEISVETIALLDQFLTLQSSDEIVSFAPQLLPLFSKHEKLKDHFCEKWAQDKEVLFNKAFLIRSEAAFMLLIDIFQESSFKLWEKAQGILKTASSDLAEPFICFMTKSLQQVEESNKKIFLTLFYHFKRLAANINISFSIEFLENGFRASEKLNEPSLKKSILQVFVKAALGEKDSLKLPHYFLHRLNFPIDDQELQKDDMSAFQLMSLDSDVPCISHVFDVVIHYFEHAVSKEAISKAYQLIHKVTDNCIFEEKAKQLALLLQSKGSLTRERCCIVLSCCYKDNYKGMFFWLKSLLDCLTKERLSTPIDSKTLVNCASQYSKENMDAIFCHPSIGMIASKETIQAAYTEFVRNSFFEAAHSQNKFFLDLSLQIYETYFPKLKLGSPEERKLTNWALNIYRTYMALDQTSDRFTKGIGVLAKSIIKATEHPELEEEALDVLLWSADATIAYSATKLMKKHRTMPEFIPWQNRLFEYAEEALALFLLMPDKLLVTLSTKEKKAARKAAWMLCTHTLLHLIRGNSRAVRLLPKFETLVFSSLCHEDPILYSAHLENCRDLYNLCLERDFFKNNPEVHFKMIIMFDYNDISFLSQDKKLEILDYIIDQHLDYKKAYVINHLMTIMRKYPYIFTKLSRETASLLITKFTSKLLSLAMATPYNLDDFSSILFEFWQLSFTYNIFESESHYIETISLAFSKGILWGLLLINDEKHKGLLGKYCELMTVALKSKEGAEYRLEMFQKFIKLLLKCDRYDIRLLGKDFLTKGLLKGVCIKVSDDLELKQLLEALALKK